MGLFDIPKKLTLMYIKGSVINPELEGIGTVEDLEMKGKDLFLRLRLNDLEQYPLEVTCSEIWIAEDNSKVSIGKFKCNLAFAQTALDRWVKGKVFDIPEGSRESLGKARTNLNI